MNVLLVEDNVGYRRTVKETLLSHFPAVNIKEASDGKAALKTFDADRPALILMDIQLPGESGLVLTKVIKEIFPEVAICMLTNHDSPEYREAAKQSGADFFLSKQTTKGDDLIDLVKQVSGTQEDSE